MARFSFFLCVLSGLAEQYRGYFKHANSSPNFVSAADYTQKAV
jgi:hypothetical protein